MTLDGRCLAEFRHRCTKLSGHGGAHASGDSAELLAERDCYRLALEHLTRAEEFATQPDVAEAVSAIAREALSEAGKR